MEDQVDQDAVKSPSVDRAGARYEIRRDNQADLLKWMIIDAGELHFDHGGRPTVLHSFRGGARWMRKERDTCLHH